LSTELTPQSQPDLPADGSRQAEGRPSESPEAATSMVGLSLLEAAERRAQGLGNNVEVQTSRTYSQIIHENVLTFINIVIFVLGLAMVILGSPSDALVSVGVIMVNVVVSVAQELRAKRTLDRIALLTRPTATVIRDGREQPIDPAAIVVGDVLVVGPGDQIVVDGQVIGDGRMDVDESLLTGESELIPKVAGDPVYSGSFCVTGKALYEAQRVGAQTVASEITTRARAYRRVLTPLQQEIDLMIRVVLLIAIYLEIMLVIVTVLEGLPIAQSVRMSMVIVGLVPNGLFLSIAVAYAIGAVRMVGRGVLLQQSNSVESLSHVDVLCLDKTGTLTTNRLQFHALQAFGITVGELGTLLGDFIASTSSGNQTSEAIGLEFPGRARRVIEEVPFSSAYKWSGLALDGPPCRGVYILGAPEVLRVHLSPEADVEQQADALAEQGLRVLLFARYPDVVPLRDDQGQPRLPEGLIPLGLVSLNEELRQDARDTLKAFADSGVEVKIISGDSPSTVVALAKRAGLGPEIRAVSGLELAEMDRTQLAQVAVSTTVFGRITPHQKEELVQALRSRGHYVAMIGDGVNDVLSLKRANLGIAMQSGSQATRSVADIVLLRDSFAVLPLAVREGQRIVNGMQGILKLYLTRVFYASILIISTSIIASAGYPFAPKHNALLTLITVGIPSLALAAWARPVPMPRGILIRRLLHFVLPASLTVSMSGLAIYLAHLIPIPAYRLIRSGAHVRSEGEILGSILPLPQTALTTYIILCGLLLILFLEPPAAALVGGNPQKGDRRLTILAGLLLIAFVAITIRADLRQFFDLALLSPFDYVLIAAAAALWSRLLLWVWRTRLLDRFLNVDLSSQGGT